MLLLWPRGCSFLRTWNPKGVSQILQEVFSFPPNRPCPLFDTLQCRIRICSSTKSRHVHMHLARMHSLLCRVFLPLHALDHGLFTYPHTCLKPCSHFHEMRKTQAEEEAEKKQYDAEAAERRRIITEEEVRRRQRPETEKAIRTYEWLKGLQERARKITPTPSTLTNNIRCVLKKVS